MSSTVSSYGATDSISTALSLERIEKFLGKGFCLNLVTKGDVESTPLYKHKGFKFTVKISAI